MSELCVGGLTLKGVASGGVETSILVPELKLMFDVGRALPGAQSVGRVLASHGHADHLGGLHYYVSQRHLHRGNSTPIVHVPAEIEDPLQRIFAAWREIEGFDLEVDIRPVRPGDTFSVGNGFEATGLRTVHRVPSLAYLVERITHKLAPEFQGASREAIKAAKEAGTTITAPHRTAMICVTGDTQIEFLERHPEVLKARVLVHEVTAWDDRRSVEDIRKWGHTHVEEMIPMAERFEGEALVLVHRSLRHSAQQAREIVAARFPASVKDRVHVFG